MRRLSGRDILDLCEDLETEGAGGKALAILRRLDPVHSDRHPDLPVGERDAALMEIRERAFGRRIDLMSRCPACGDPVELDVAASELGFAGRGARGPTQPARRRLCGADLLLRPVTAGDLARAEVLADVDAVYDDLLSHCVLEVDEVVGAPAPEACRPAIEQALEDLDPAADIALELTCPSCAAMWSEAFDPMTLLWSEMTAQARRLLGEVADLARIYHWSESDILAMSPARRRFYLEAAS
jgi:hypothetical protein